MRRSKRRIAQVMLACVLVALAAIAAARLAGGRRHSDDAGAGYSLQTIERRDIAQTVEATGTVEPVEVVEIKSKASGQIVRMPVEVGSIVRAGQLLAQIDTVNVQNQYDEAAAALDAARIAADVSASALRRSDTLFARGLVPAADHEAAQTTEANARSALAKARSAFEIARQALADATVRAPSDGTVIEQDATRGQVIASVTASASGGTTLLRMADLGRVQVRALVPETDVAGVKPGVEATVTVDAYPHRTFTGRVLKVEPQATVQQSVTMFPVLVTIDNRERLLLPGMNGEVVIGVASRTHAVAVPLEAVRSSREAGTAASALGLDAGAVTASLASPSRAGGGDDVVFVRTASGLEPRVVTLGVSDDDYGEVLAGVKPGEQVALIGVAEEQAERAGEKARIQSRMPGMPGMVGSSSRASARPAANAAGGK